MEPRRRRQLLRTILRAGFAGHARRPADYSSGLKWAGTDSRLYAVDQQIPQDFLVLGVGASGPVRSFGHSGTQLSLGYEWDPAKARANFEKHGIHFADAATTLEDDFA
jgi:hypothetical protein